MGGRRVPVRILASAAAVTMAAGVAGCGGSSGSDGAGARSGTQVVTSVSGEKATIPIRIDRIAEQFPAHTVTDLMLGVGDRLVAIPQNVKTIPFLRKVYPRIANVPELFASGGKVNMEELLKLDPDVVSTIDGGNTLIPFQHAGLPAVNMSFDNFGQLAPSIELAGTVYGGDATARAKAYVDYVNGKAEMVRKRLAGLPDAEKPSVVHISSYPPLVVDGGSSLIDDWITIAGGRDAAKSVPGTHVTVSVEQLLQWNPDVLIIQTPGGDQGLVAAAAQSVVDKLAKSPGWADLKAVKGNRVYFNPQGLYPWDRFGPEEALQIQWAAQALHPGLFTDLDMRAETRGFYKKFFNYEPTEADLDLILQVKDK
ncbi:ABC transporter substrate-binding protein [Frankia sp. CiP3]|uniref:ABC transporter substrate-binding protein n=1 Tax=Frankia sp. CiP3 TaxID=2880971 RepID=UPI001EF3FE22|nr:ABC transporter substrate-binding protein [Frankia sp. CiP3]